MSRRIYKNPPIVEAVCEFRFDSQDWDVTLPGKLYPHIKKQYSEKPIQIQEQLLVPRGTTLDFKSVNKVQFVNKDKSRNLSLTPGALAIHDLHPYSGWESFRERIITGLEEYQKVSKKQSVTRVGIRYINRIELGEKEFVDLDEYFCGLPNQPKQWPRTIHNFVFHVEFAYPEEEIGARVVFSSQPTSPSSKKKTEGKKDMETLAVMLDIDVYSHISGKKLTKSKLLKLVEDLRDKEREIFESVITEKSRSMFND